MNGIRIDWRQVQQLVFGSSPKASIQSCTVHHLAQDVQPATRELVERALDLFVKFEFLGMQPLYRVSDVESHQDLHSRKGVTLWKTTVAMKLKRLSSGCDRRQQKHGAVCPHLLALLGAARIRVSLAEGRRKSSRRNVDAAPLAGEMKEIGARIAKSREYHEAVALFIEACGDAGTLAYCLQTPAFG